MIPIPMEDANKQARILGDIAKKGSVKPLPGDVYLEKSMNFQSDIVRREYPQKILLPKDMNSLMRGDYSPSREIIIEEPLFYEKEGFKIPMWFGDTIKGIPMSGLGFQDGDSRKPCNVTFNDNSIHGAMNGATGQGKSVVLEGILEGLFMQLPPWEIRLVLVDAKIATFQKFGYDPIIPHISSIAATEDVDFLISVLEWEVKRMQTLNAMIPKAGHGDKIEDFRKGTGLCIPRTLIIVEEFTAMTMNAGKKLRRLMELLHLFVVLGRSTGVHLFLSTQAFDSKVNTILDQIQIRSALGCSSKVSKKILGNTEAKNNLGKKGRFIINMQPEDENPKDNKHFRVPYSPTSESRPRLERVVELSKLYNYEKDMSFYDEHDRETIHKMADELEKYKRGPHRLFLGEPGFMTERVDGFRRVAIDYDGNDRDSMLVVSGSDAGITRAFGMLGANYRAFKGMQHFVATADNAVWKQIEAMDLGIDFTVKNVGLTTDPGFDRLYMSFFIRKLAVDSEAYIADGEIINEQLLTTYKEQFETAVQVLDSYGYRGDTPRNRQRFCAACEKFHTKEFSYLASQGKTALTSAFTNYILFCEMYGAQDRQLVREDLPNHVNWVVGIDRITGLGRSPSFKEMDMLRVLLLDGYKYNLRYHLFARNIEETGSLATAVRYGWMEPPVANKTISGFKIQDYFPSEVPTYSIALYDANETDELMKVVKFKKAVLDGEF